MSLFLIAAYDRFDLAACGVVAVLIMSGYGLTKRDASEFADANPRLCRTEKLMIWATISMLSMIVLATASRS